MKGEGPIGAGGRYGDAMWGGGPLGVAMNASGGSEFAQPDERLKGEGEAVKKMKGRRPSRGIMFV